MNMMTIDKEIFAEILNPHICLECGYVGDVNNSDEFSIDAADEEDPHPSITCLRCGGVAEPYDGTIHRYSMECHFDFCNIKNAWRKP